MLKYLKSLVKNNTGDSSKSFSLVLSAIVGALIGVCISFVLIYDVCVDGIINTDLGELGVFLMAVGVFMVGGGFSKTITEKILDKPKKMDEEEKTKESWE
jgi:putative copper export protein